MLLPLSDPDITVLKIEDMKAKAQLLDSLARIVEAANVQYGGDYQVRNSAYDKIREIILTL